MPRIDYGRSPAVRAHYAEWRARHEATLRALTNRVGEIAEKSRARESQEPGQSLWHKKNADPPAERPLAAVFDIDEVLLCNLRDKLLTGRKAPDNIMRTFPPLSVTTESACPHAQRLHAAATSGYSPLTAWPDDATWAHLTADGSGLNPPMPGARELLTECHRHGMTIFLVTGREEYLISDTRANLDLAGMLGDHTGLTHLDLSTHRTLPRGERPSLQSLARLEAGGIFMWPGRKGAATIVPPYSSVAEYKREAQEYIACRYRIALNVGDQLSDLALGDEQILIPHSFYHTE